MDRPAVFDVEMEIRAYHYTPGPLGLRWLEEIRRGSIKAARCQKCGLAFIPPKIYCPSCFHEVSQLVEIEGKPYLAGYTIMYRDFGGKLLEKPLVVGLIMFPGVSGGLIHYVEARPEDLKTGAALEPVFRKERRGSITDIEYFRIITAESLAPKGGHEVR